LRKKEGIWAMSILFIVLLAFILPFTLFSGTAKWYGSLLLWIILTIIVMVINYFLTKNWGK